MIRSLKTHYDTRLDVSDDMSDMQSKLAQRFARSHIASPPSSGHGGRSKEPMPHHPSASPSLVASAIHSGSDSIPHPVWISPQAPLNDSIITEDPGAVEGDTDASAFHKLSAVLGNKYK